MGLKIFADDLIASAILDRLLHHSTTINTKCEGYRLKDKKARVIGAKNAVKEWPCWEGYRRASASIRVALLALQTHRDRR